MSGFADKRRQRRIKVRRNRLFAANFLKRVSAIWRHGSSYPLDCVVHFWALSARSGQRQWRASQTLLTWCRLSTESPSVWV